MAKELTFSQLKKKLEKKSVLINAESLFNKDTTFIHSGNYMLNALLSADLMGGYPEGRIISLSGFEGSGKTFLVLNAIREFQKAGYSIKMYETEGAINKKLTNHFEISTDEDNWEYNLVSTVENFKIDMTNTVQSLIDAKRKGYKIPKMLFVLDSAGMLASKKEVEDALAGKDKVDMTRAKVLKSVFRILTPKLVEIGATFIFTNHTYKETGLYAKTVASGGKGLAYAASCIVFLTKAQLKDGETKSGIIVSAKTEKNRFARPEIIKFHIRYTEGMNKYIGLHKYLGWDICGIDNGKVLDESAFSALVNKKGKSNTGVINKIKDTKWVVNDKPYYFINASYMKKFGIDGITKFAVKHLLSEVDVSELFSNKVFSVDVLKQLNETVISQAFGYGVSNVDSFEEVFKEIESDKEKTI